MPTKPRDVARDAWPAALVAVTLVAPILVDTIAHPELATALLALGLTLAGAWRLLRRQTLELPWGATLALGALLVFLGTRSVFAPEPVVSLFGAYSTDASLWALACTALAFVAGFAWRRTGALADSRTLTPLLAVITLYATASGIAAWEWGSTDGVGGPPSGFTSNSQYQLQLLVLGLACALAWAWLARRQPLELAVATIAAIVIAVNIRECRAASAIPALLAAVAYAFIAARWARTDRGARWIAAAGTVLVALAGTAVVWMLAISPSTTTYSATFDRLGSDRGTLWSSASSIVAAHPLIGRGSAHATAVTRWSLNGDSLNATTTVDPHNLFLSLAIGGGVVGVLLALWALYAVQLTLLSAVARSDGPDRANLLVLCAGGAGLFTFAQFAFLYPVAWAVAALLLGLAAGVRPKQDRAAQTTPSADDLGRASAPLAIGGLTLAAVLLVLMGPAVSARIASLHLDTQARTTPPAALLEGQLALVARSADVKPAAAAFAILSAGLRENGPAVKPYLAPALERTAIVDGNMRWDARLATSRLNLWSAAAAAGEPDRAALERIVSAGIAADPACGMWASAGASLAYRHGFDDLATGYARRVAADAGWSAQLARSADASTVALIESLAAP